MEKVVIKKVKEYELPALMTFKLSYLYKFKPGQFAAIYSAATGVLFVEEKIPERDIQKFITMVEYEGKYINDPDCEIADIVGCIYKKYGYKTWGMLFEAYKDRYTKKEDETAKQDAEKLYKVIHGFDSDDNIPDIFGNKERLIYHLGRMAMEEGLRTPENLVGYGTKYAFLFGYLLGNGVIKETCAGAISGNVTLEPENPAADPSNAVG